MRRGKPLNDNEQGQIMASGDMGVCQIEKQQKKRKYIDL